GTARLPTHLPYNDSVRSSAQRESGRPQLPRWHHVFVDAVLRQALEPVLRDLKRGGLDEPRIEDCDWTGGSESTSAMLWGPDGDGSGVSVLRSASPAERIADIADQVQEWAIEDQ